MPTMAASVIPESDTFAERQRHARKAGDEDDRSERHIAVFAVIDLIIHEDAQAGGADHAVQQERNTADDRAGNGLDEGSQRPTNEQIMDSTAAPPMTRTEYTFVIAITPMFSP